MARMTLLEMTQNVLSSCDSDSVNSISDTIESMQVATIIRNKYFDIAARGLVPEQQQLFQLTPSVDPTKPTQMTLPSNVSRLLWVKYFDSNPADNQQQSQFGSFAHGLNLDLVNTTTFTTTSTTSNNISTGAKTFVVASSGLPITTGQGVMAYSGVNFMFGTVTSYSGTTLVMNVTSTIGSGTYTTWTITNNTAATVAGYKYVTLIPVDQFLDFVNRFNPSDRNTGSYTFTEGGYNFSLYFKNNIQPQYATAISNSYVLFDAYNNVFDSTLQGSKTLCYGEVVPVFTMADTFIPNLDDQWFPLLLNESKSLAWVELKQQPNPKAEQEIKRQWSVVQKKGMISEKPSYFDALANFGRVPRTGGYSSGGYGAYKWMRQASP